MGQDIAAGRIEHQLGLKLRCSPAGTGTCVEVIEPPTALMPEVWSPDSPKERACGGKILEGDILMTVGQIFVNRMPLDELQNLLLGPPGASRPRALEPTVQCDDMCNTLVPRQLSKHRG
jgi:hypothetical protein